jgi:hypothetical protein
LHGSGFLAVYLAGLALGSVDFPAKPSVDAFHEGLAAVAEIGMFFALGLLVFPSQLDRNLLESTLLALIVAFIARPLAAAAATAFEHFSARDRLLLGWTGLRGAVPVILATFPVIEGIPRSLEFFNVVFFAVWFRPSYKAARSRPFLPTAWAVRRRRLLQTKACDGLPEEGEVKKTLLFLVMVLAGASALNARLSASRECACEQGCWCKKPLLQHYRWIVPFSHKLDFARLPE